ncbi:TetR/AcrR family transcriptional regulator [Hyphomonas sp. WL0036]|uniref:TetR/AcrR family transcriptional regulator n=1 Tax=Hyphomonas sediminis TaxID=2866160 RepID=UPI001C7FE8CE|nr:TetR/AcrR family transcriptional regulator [Hyphomonas sediminis]MBY9065392.1 TetR/AcrR family transcriptional regulator [Hyphomonas sediminis]
MSSETLSLREAQRELTRNRILDAALDLISEEPLDAITLANVAARAAVTERTLYRYFATRDELVEALWPRINDRAAHGRTFPETPEAMIRQPSEIFPGFDQEEGLTRFVFTRQGQELRLSVNDKRQAAFLQAVAKARPDLGESDRRELAAICQLLDSSFAWVSLKDYWGIEGNQSGPLASETIQLLLAQFRRKGAGDTS